MEGTQGPEAGGVVGPPEDPDRYRLGDALDASGRLWSARGRGGRPAIVHVLTADDETWAGVAGALQTLSTPNVASVLDTFTLDAAIRCVVSEIVDGVPLDEWVRLRRQSTTSERLSLLQQVAASLDDIHGGSSSGLPLMHGALSPAALVIQADVRAVVVGVGGIAQEPGQDAADFALLVAQCVVGDATSNAAAVVQTLAASPAGQQRPALAKQIASVLDAPPLARPRRLGPWLAAASGDHGGTVANPSVAASLPPRPTATSAPTSRRRYVLAGAIGTVGVAALCVGIIISAGGKHNGAAAKTPPVRDTTPSGPLQLQSWSWPMTPGCDSTTSVAYTDDSYASPQRFGNGDVRSQIAGSEAGGAWYQGVLRFTLKAGDKPVFITNIVPRQRGGALHAPVWILRPGPNLTCPARVNPPDHAYLYDITRRSMVFNAFQIPAHTSQTVEITVRDCSGNQAEGMEIHYAVNGQDNLLDTHQMRGLIFGLSPGASVFTTSPSGRFGIDASILVHDKACA